MDTIKEADISRACLDYLEAMRIPYLRLNSGDVFRPGAAGKMYKVKGCPKGTSDILILACIESKHEGNITYAEPRPIFVEFKSSKGKQNIDQQEFEQTVKHNGYEYVVIRSIDELIEVLK